MINRLRQIRGFVQKELGYVNDRSMNYTHIERVVSLGQIILKGEDC